jgi:parallel beta-helix repeat protein
MNVSRSPLRAALAALVLVVAAGLGSATAGATSGTLYVTSNTTLKEDHQGTIVIAADNVTLDCTGHAVVGPGATGITVLSRSHASIRNCRVSGFGSGIVLQQSAFAVVSGNTVDANTGVGITAYSATDSTFTGNVVSRNLEGFRVVPTGLPGQPSARNTLTGNTATGNSRYGFELADLQDSNVTRNVASGNTWDGFVASSSNHGVFSSRLVANRSDTNGNFGFSLPGVSGVAVSQNSATGNAIGFWLSGSGSTGNILSGNTAAGNSWEGFEIANAASSNLLVANTSTGNGADGYQVLGYSTQNRLLENIASGNGGDGFASYGAKGNAYLGNRASGNKTGFALRYGSAQNSVGANVAASNGIGFLVQWGSTGNAFALNTGQGNKALDAQDENPAGANSWKANSFGTSSPPGLGFGRSSA